jgi:hypothetical protein
MPSTEKGHNIRIVMICTYLLMAITDGVIAADPDEWTTTCQPKFAQSSLMVMLCAIAVAPTPDGLSSCGMQLLSAHFARERALAHYNSFHVVVPHGVYLFLLATGLMKRLERGMYVTRLWLNS